MCTGAWLRTTPRTAERTGGVFDRCGTELDGAVHEFAQHPEVKRLRHEIEGAELQRPHRRFDVAVRGDHRDRQGGAVLLDPGHQVESITVGQTHVREAKVEALRLQQPPRTLEVGSRARLEMHSSQGEAHQLHQVGLVIHDEHGRVPTATPIGCDCLVHFRSQRRGSANTSRNTLPPPARGS